MEMLSSGGRFLTSGCYALLSRDANVLDLSKGMRELCRRFRPQADVPRSFKSLIIERDHPLLLEHLERVWLRQQSDSLHLEVARTFGTPLKARIYSVPAPREKAVQSFLSLEGRDSSIIPIAERPREDRPAAASGFMVLRTEGDSDRLAVAFCDACCREMFGIKGGALAERPLYQAFPPETCQTLNSAFRDARSTGEPRACRLRTAKGEHLRAFVFVSGRSIMVLTDGHLQEGRTSGTTPPVPDRATSRPGGGESPELDTFIETELRPGLRALRNLARSLDTVLPAGSPGARRASIIEELSGQIFHAIENLGHSPAADPGLSEGEDILRRLVEGVRDVVHQALSNQTYSVAIIDEVPSGTRIFSTYTLASLQQVLVDLIGEASSVVPQSALECAIRQVEETAGRITLGFEVTARSVLPPSGIDGPSHAAALAERPMFKAARRFLKALGAELHLEADESTCHYSFSLPFGKLSVLESA